MDVLDRYWSQAQYQVASLESRLGSVQHIYHETVTESGAPGLEYLREAAFHSYPLVQERCKMGATLEATEDPKFLLEVSRCIGTAVSHAAPGQPQGV